MIYKTDIKSLAVGLFVGLVVLAALGATSNRSDANYQLSMTAAEGYIVYGRIHTGTGKVETWKYMLHANNAIPHLGDNTNKLLRPDSR